jgi:cytidine deaminase
VASWERTHVTGFLPWTQLSRTCCGQALSSAADSRQKQFKVEHPHIFCLFSPTCIRLFMLLRCTLCNLNVTVWKAGRTVARDRSRGWKGRRWSVERRSATMRCEGSSKGARSTGTEDGGVEAARVGVEGGKQKEQREQSNGILVDLAPDARKRAPGREDVTQGLAVLEGRFALTPEQVKHVLSTHQCSTDELLTLLISPASKLARPPISSFHVGAVGLGASGALYVGVNLEFARLPLYNSVHAEQFLLVNALHHGERAIQKLAISAAPCGHCRQFYSELACADSVKFSFQGGTYLLDELLPHRFKPTDLLADPSTPLLLQSQNNRIKFSDSALSTIDSNSLIHPPNGDLGRKDEVFRDACSAAFTEARSSYSPYSRCPAGVAIITWDNCVYSGGYIESAAYNPSIPPLQTAIIDAVIDGMPCYTEVKDVVLVELRHGRVQHETTTRVILEQIAPEARLTVLHAEWEE